MGAGRGGEGGRCLSLSEKGGGGVGWALIRGWALINFFRLKDGRNSRLGAYSNKYGNSLSLQMVQKNRANLK